MDKVYYYNRNGVLKFTFNEDPYYIDTSVWKDWSWEYESEYSKIKYFRRSKETYPFKVIVVSKSLEDRDALCDVFDDDVMANEMGYFMYRGWRLDCYVTQSEHSYFDNPLEWTVDFDAISETSTWVRETTNTYGGIDASQTQDLGRDYKHESGDDGASRGYENASSETTNELMNSFGESIVDSDGNILIDSYSGTAGANGYGYSIVSSYFRYITLPYDENGFRVTFYGAVTNPVIYLNSQPVRVYATISDGERLEVTSNGRERSIYKISPQGEKTNMFIYRDKEHSPFFSLGKYVEITYGDVKFDLTTIEQRSEPSWN